MLRVFDGETIEVRRADGEAATVRYIGVDSPEVDPDRGGPQPFGEEASRRNEELLAGGEVFLEIDVSDVDRFGRLLRHVWVPDGGGGFLLASLVLLQEGLAAVTTVPPDARYAADFESAEAAARAAAIGIWSGPADACDPAYPDVCIPPPPPDLDCGEIEFRRFRVVGDDPHRFDGDDDGLGCES